MNFIRGERDKIANVTKEFMEDTMPKYLAPRDEPDFYSMEPAVSKRPEPKPNAGANRKRKPDRNESSKTKPAPARKANNSRKRARTTEDKKVFGFATEIHRESSSESSHESEDHQDEEYITKPSTRAPARRTPRVRPQQFHYDEEVKPRKRLSTTASNSSRESSKSDEEMEMKDSMEDDYTDSPDKESPILLAPSKPVFSGFNLPFKKLKLVVMSAGDFEGEDPFAVKRPGMAKKGKKVAAA